MPFTTPAAVVSGAVISKTTFGDVVINDLNALANPAAVRAISTSTATITQNTWTAIAFGAADEYDTQNMHDTVTNNSRITIPAGWGGLYVMNAGAGFAANTSNGRALGIRKNGTGTSGPTWGGQMFQAAGAFGTYLNVSVTAKLAAGDYIEALVFQSTAAGLALVTSDGNHWFTATWIGLG